MHTSLVVAGSLSLQSVPLPAIGSPHRPVFGSQVPTVWHWSLAVQLTAAQRSNPLQTPPVHTSLVVAGSPSSQPLPLLAAGLLQTPVPWSQLPTSWHWSLAVQVTAAQRSTPLQTPPVHTSLVVAGSPSSQTVPLSAAGSLQMPVAWLHTPESWHWSLAVQVTAAQRSTPLQTPPVHTSLVVATLPSSHEAPSLAATASQALLFSLQLPVLHWVPAPEQSLPPPPPQAPAVQVSPVVQKAPSSQALPSLATTASQALLLSLQLPEWH